MLYHLSVGAAKYQISLERNTRAYSKRNFSYPGRSRKELTLDYNFLYVKYPSLLPAPQMTAEQLTHRYNTMNMSSQPFSDANFSKGWKQHFQRFQKNKYLFIYKNES